MAKLQMCCVLDMVAQQYGRPFFAISEGSALRGFSDEINRPGEDSMLYQHPADFQLFHLGTYDDETGGFEINSTPKLIVAGSAVAQRPE